MANMDSILADSIDLERDQQESDKAELDSVRQMLSNTNN